MPFERITQRAFSGRRGLPASLALNCRKNGGRPACVISLQAEFVRTTNFTADCKFHVAIGTGIDEGKIRIERADDGIFGVRGMKGSLLFDLGYIAALGEHAQPRAFTTAAYADGAVVIDIPEAGDAGDESDEEEDQEEPVATPPKAAAAQPARTAAPSPAAPQARKSAGGSVVRLSGVDIDLAVDNESVSFSGKTIEVSTRGARLVEVLARVRPNCVGDDFIIGKLWTVRPAGVATLLDMVVRDLGSLKTIGLEVRKQKGIGHQLVEIDR